MGTKLVVAVVSVCAPSALAQQVVAPPTREAPAANASIEDRADWCDGYTSWLVTMAAAPSDAPADVREGQHLQVELNACKIDPQRYESDTRADTDHAVPATRG